MKRTMAAGNYVRAGFAVLGLMSFGAGCVLKPAMPISPEYYLIGIADCKETDLISDLQIVQCASRVEEGLRQRYNNSRLARTEGGIIQVLTAGVSSMLTGIAGANGLTAGTILSGISAMMPEVSNVIEAKDRAEAYSDGMKSIGTAFSVYRTSIAESHEGTVDSTKITPAGATLYTTLRSAISVVESRLAGLLPTTKELMQARSELERFERVEVIPSELSLPPLDPKKLATATKEAADAKKEAEEKVEAAKVAEGVASVALKAAEDAKNIADEKTKSKAKDTGDAVTTGKKSAADADNAKKIAEQKKKEATEFENKAKEKADAKAKAEAKSTATLTVVYGGHVRATSGNNQVATVKETPDSNGTKFDVVATGDCQWTTISLSNGTGGKESVLVRVEPDSAFEVAEETVTVSKAAATPRKMSNLVRRGCLLKAVKSANKAIAEVTLVDEQAIEVKGMKADDSTTLWLENKSGRRASIKVVVTP